MGRVTAVLDVGKTNVKVLVFDGGAIVFRRSAPNPVRPGPPYPHVDTGAIWRFMLAGLRDAAAAHAIGCVVVTTHGASVTLAGKDDVAAPILDYEFDGPEADEQDYATVRPPFAETLTPAMPAGLNWARQVFYVMRHHPELFARTRHILMYPQYWGLRLTGVARNEVTNLGCHGEAWDPRAGRPSSLVERLDWTRLLPPVIAAWEELGPLKPEIAAETGLRPGTPVLAGLHDSNASIVPYLLSLPVPFTVISTGTWVVIVGVGFPVDRVTPQNLLQANVDVLGRAGPVARFMGGREFAVLTEGHPQEADETDLAAVLASGCLALPSFAPQASPVRKQGRIEGTLPDRPGAHAALATLYEALFSDFQLDTMGAAEGPIVVEGPFAANALFSSILAALRPSQPILVDTDTAGAAYGAALLAEWPSPPDCPPLGTARPLRDEHGLAAHKRRWREALAGLAPELLAELDSAAG